MSAQLVSARFPHHFSGSGRRGKTVQTGESVGLALSLSRVNDIPTGSGPAWAAVGDKGAGG
jgi:hypothetical protein